MSLKYVFFDLDGTLLPMDQDFFIKTYFSALAKKMAPHGYEPEKLIKAIWDGTAAMICNDGTKLNETAFWDTFSQHFGKISQKDYALFDEFYSIDFDSIRSVCGYNPQSADIVHKLKDMGIKSVLATNPLFPAAATRCRIRWAGLTTDDFELYTTYENSTFCKPNLDYYREIMQKIGCTAEDCLMVGNDVSDDMPAEKLGMKVFLLTDCLINKDDADISVYPHGDFSALMQYIEKIR